RRSTRRRRSTAAHVPEPKNLDLVLALINPVVELVSRLIQRKPAELAEARVTPGRAGQRQLLQLVQRRAQLLLEHLRSGWSICLPPHRRRGDVSLGAAEDANSHHFIARSSASSCSGLTPSSSSVSLAASSNS